MTGTTIVDKVKLIHAVYELVENDDTFLPQSKENYVEKETISVVDAIAERFLAGVLSVQYDPRANSLIYSVLKSGVPRQVYSSVSLAVNAGFELLRAGTKLANRRMLDEAVEIFEQAAKVTPIEALAHLYLAQAYYDQSLAEKAEHSLRRALKLSPDKMVRTRANELLGEVYLTKGLFDKAIACFKHVLELDPSSAEGAPIHFNLGFAYYYKGLVDSAVAELKQALVIDASFAPGHYILARAYSTKGMMDDAMKECKLAKELDPNDSRYCALLGTLYFDAGLWDESIEEYKRAIRLSRDPEFLAMAHNNLGVANIRGEKRDNALREFKKAFQLDPKDKAAKHNMALVIEEIGLPTIKKKGLRKMLRTPKQLPLEYEFATARLRDPVMISPRTPFTNKLNFWSVIKQCKGYVHWFDKFFSEPGLELLSECLDADRINEVKILMTIQKGKDYANLRKSFKNLQDEGNNRGIKCELRVILDPKTRSQIHDRWIISDNNCFNVPSTDTIARGQFSEIKATTNRPPFDNWWENSKDIINDWEEILGEIAK